jgi:zinc protease
MKHYYLWLLSPLFFIILANLGLAQKAPEIKFEKYRLANGLQVILHQDRKLPVAHVNLWYHVGSKNEKERRTGFAHLFEHMMFQGSKNANGEYISFIEKAGANLREGGVNGTTSFDHTTYFETVPSESLEYALWLESDRMGYLTDVLTQEKLDNQRDVVKNERRQSYENVPYGRAFQMIFENLFPKGHPYSWLVIGSQEDLTAASVEDVKEFFKTYYTPNNCSLVIAGDFEIGEAKQLVEKYFGSFEPGPSLERPRLWVPKLDGEKRVQVADRVPQERVYVVWPTPAYFQPGDAELDLASRILSQGKNSRLYKTLVYDKQIASDVSAFNYSLEISGVFGVIATARPGHSLDEIEKVIYEEIARFAQNGPEGEELMREKAKQEFDFISGLERIGGFGGKADLLNQYNTFLGSPDFFQRDYDRYQKCSATQIRDVVRQYLDTGNRLVVSFVPEQSDRPKVTEADRTKTPGLGDKRTFEPPTFSTQKVSNGLTVVVSERHELPKVAAGLMLKTGATADPATKSGVAWMTAEMLDEGTTSRSALQIQADLDRLGSSLHTSAGSESSEVSLETLKKNLKPTLEIMADLILHPTFPEEELERQRKRRLDSILQERSNPPAIASKVFRFALFGEKHPLGRETDGNEASIKALSRADLQEFYQEYWKPNNAALIFSGDVNLEEAVRLAEEVLGSWRSSKVPDTDVPSIDPPTGTQVYLVDRQDAAQSQIRIGSVGPRRRVDDYYAIELMNAVLGGAFTSRLNLNLREEKGYTYGAFSGFSYGRQIGFWTGRAAVQTKFTKESLAEFEKEFNGIREKKPITSGELEIAKANLTRGFAQRFETLERLIQHVDEIFSYDLPSEEISRYPSEIEKVTLEQARAAARKYISVSGSIIVIVGDLSKIEKGIRELNLGTVTVIDVDGKKVR